MKDLIKKNLGVFTVGALVVVSIGGAIWYFQTNRPPSFSTSAVTLGNVVNSVNVPGTVATENSASLSFQEAGEIASVNVSEDDNVAAGEVLASLNKASLIAGLDQANAGLAAAQAQLGQLASGTRPEQLQIDEGAVATAQNSIQVDAGNAYSSADDAVHNQTDNVFSNPRSNNPTLLVPVTNSQQQLDIQSQRLTIEGVLGNWYAALNASSSDQAFLSMIAETSLQQIQSYLDTLALAINDATPNGTVTTSVLAGYKVNIATARTEVGAAITTLTGAESALQAAQNQLALAQAGSTPQDIQAQQAAVLQAQAQVASAQVAVNNADIVAPFAGTVQNLTAQVGQVVSPGVPVLSLINSQGLKIQAYVSETDVASVKAGDAANVTLDAFGTGTAFPATVTAVDPSQTQVNGTPAYLVTLHFKNADTQVKDGMTGNVEIVTAEHDGVAEIPSRLIINNNDNYFVLVPSDGTTEQKPVQIGIVGDDGMTEITSGLSVGDQVANF